MKKLTPLCYALFIPIVLVSTLSVQGMKRLLSKSKQSKQLVPQAKEYDDSYSLNSLPNEILINIFFQTLVADEEQTDSFENNIKNFVQLNSVCKKFNSALTFNNVLTVETIRDFCKNCDQYEKDQVLCNLIEPICSVNYNAYRLPLLLLIYAGADVNIKRCSDPLLSKVVRYNDVQMANILFKHHAESNVIPHGTPTFFFAKTVAMAQVFINNGANVHKTIRDKTNVLWHTYDLAYPADLMEFYLGHNVDAKNACADKSCLLHGLALQNYNENVHNLDTFTDSLLKKAGLLLDVIPDMINTLNQARKTPLDFAQQSLKYAQNHGPSEVVIAFEKLIALFRERGAFTA